MKKGINMRAQVHLAEGTAAVAEFRKELPQAFTQANPGMTLHVKGLSHIDSGGSGLLRFYIEGEQDPAADFNALATSAFQKAMGSLGNATAANIQEVEDDEEDGAGLVLPPQQAPAQPALASSAPPSPPPAAPQPPPAPEPPAQPQPQAQAQVPPQPQPQAQKPRSWWRRLLNM